MTQVNDISCHFDYPIYCIKAINEAKCVISGGGGSAKTGVANIIDVVDFHRHSLPKTIKDFTASISQNSKSLDTDPNAVMRFIVLNSFVTEKNKSVARIATLEGSKVVNYTITSDLLDQSKTDFKKVTELDLHEDLCSIAVSSFLKSRYLAVGSTGGVIFILEINSIGFNLLHKIPIKLTEKTCVTNLDFAPSNHKITSTPTLFVSLCDRPDGTCLRFYSICKTKKVNSLVHEIDVKSTNAFQYHQKLNLKNDAGLRFKHCEYLDLINETIVSKSENEITLKFDTHLIATIMPIRYTVKGTKSTLSIWQVRYEGKFELLSKETKNNNSDSNKTLNCIDVENVQSICACEIDMALGQIPSCLATKSSNSMCLISVGSMEGHIYVYLFLPQNKSLTCVYTKQKAHSIFVTSLDFLPERRPIKDQAKISPLIDQRLVHFELASVSADQEVKWHSGPTLTTVSDASYFDGALLDHRKRCTIKSFLSTAYFILFLIAPLILILLEKTLNSLF